MCGVKKIFVFLGHTIKMVFSNMPRLVMSICGLFIGLFIFTIGLLLLNSYYDECLDKAMRFSDNTIMLHVGGDRKDIDEMIKKCTYRNMCIKYVSDEEKPIYIKQYTNNQYCIMNAKMIGTSNMGDMRVFSKYDDATLVPYDVTMKTGRYITSTDVANENKVVVIDEFVAKLLFGDENPVGKKIIMGAEAEGMTTTGEGLAEDNEFKEFEIVGVYSNEYISKENELKYQKFLHVGRQNLILNTMLYIPSSVFEKMYGETEPYILFESDDTEKLDKFLEKYKTIYSASFYRFDIISKEEITELLTKDLQPVKLFLYMVLFVLLLVSGVNSMNTMFFSVKERMGEIGIKKSLGAGKKEIVLQFVLEGLLMSICAGVIAVTIAVFLGGYMGGLVQSVMYINFTVHYSVKSVLIPLGIAAVYGIIFSFVPSFYGANIKVTDALRFE